MSREKESTTDVSARRNALLSSATLAGAVAWTLAATACGGSSSIDSDGSEGAEESGEPSRPDADIGPLNALLGAEYQAVAAYEAGKGLIEEAPESDVLVPLRATLLEIASAIQGHHQAHASALRDAISELGGTPVEESAATAELTFPELLLENPTIDNVLRFAAGAERAAAIAYNQVIAGLEASTTRYLAGSILGDETEHFIVLAALVLGLAEPGPELDETRSEEVIPTAFISEVGGRPGLADDVNDYFS